MKNKYLNIIIFLLIVLNINAQNYYEFVKGDTLFVRAISGLNLRSEANKNSEIIEKIPYGSSLIVENPSCSKNEFSEIIIEAKHLPNKKNSTPQYSINGKMIKIIYNKKEGYVYSGYLSRIKPILKNVTEFPILSSELKKQFGILKTLKFDKTNNTEIIYNNGFIETEYSGEGGGWWEKTYCFPNFNFDDAALIISNIANTFYKGNTDNSFFYITNIDENHISLIDTSEMYSLSVKKWHNIIIITFGASG